MLTREDLVTYDQVPELEQEWFVRGRIPMADVSVIAGDSEVGKGRLTADLIARCTRGDEMPDGEEANPAGSCILISPEDKAETTTVHALVGAGADLSKVINLTKVNGQRFKLPDHIGALRAAIAAAGDVRLVVIDPIMAVSSVNMGSNRIVRTRIVEPLQDVAEDTGAAIGVVAHPVKRVTLEDLKNGIGGSKGLTDAVRCASYVIRDPANPDVRLVLAIKSNLTRKEELAPWRFVIEGEAPHGHVRYLETTEDVSPREEKTERGQEPRPGSGQARVLTLLRKENRPMSGQEVAQLSDITYGTVAVLLSRLVAADMVIKPSRGVYTHRPKAAVINSQVV